MTKTCVHPAHYYATTKSPEKPTSSENADIMVCFVCKAITHTKIGDQMVKEDVDAD